MEIKITSIKKKICNMFEKEYNLLTGNGTTAIWLALKALGIKNKRVVVPINTCFVVICAILWSDNLPYFVDIDENHLISPDELKTIESPDIAAVIFPYMYGNTGKIKEVISYSSKKGWVVIEDVAQSLGARIGRRFAGSFANITISSFGMGKIIDLNAGGFISVNSRDIYKKSLDINAKLAVRNEKKWNEYLRFNHLYCQFIECHEQGDQVFRFGDALIKTYQWANLVRMEPTSQYLSDLNNGLSRLDEALQIRKSNAVAFQRVLPRQFVAPLKHNDGATYWRQNIIVKNNRDGLLRFLKKRKIKASKYFPSIDRLFFPREGRKYTVSDSMAKQVINLWPGKETKGNDIFMIADEIKRFYEE